jgi:PAS domain S-box-containing protein
VRPPGGDRPPAAAVTDEEGRVLEVDRTFECVFGLASGRSAAGAPLAELIIAPRFRAAYRSLLREVVSAGASLLRTSEFSVLGADGGELPVELSVGRTREDPAQITTRVRVRGDLEVETAEGQSTPSLQRHVEELAGIGTWEFEPNAGRLEWSENLFRLLGLEPGAVAPSFDYLAAQAHAEDRERVLHAHEELHRTGRVGPLRFRHLLPDGRVRHLHASTSLVSSTRDPRQQTFGILADITHQRIAEQERASRLAVTDALANWEPGTAGLQRLIRDLAEPLDFEVGALWVRDGDARVVRATWQSKSIGRPQLARRLREARRRLKAGVVGAAWQTARPVSVFAMPHSAERDERLEADLQGALALPATFGDEVLAVLSLASREKVELGGRLLRSLACTGNEIGQFLARRRGELSETPLTPRELEVLQLVSSGGSRIQVADRLHVSESTVKTHLEHIYAKLGAHDRAAAVGAAMRQGLIT